MNINQEFKQLIPPLTTEELEALEKSLLTEGCRDAIITWQDTIIDGHNRYAICTKHSIPYKTESKEFASEDDVKIWMINNQLSRRNISAYDRTRLNLKLEEYWRAKAKENQAKAGGDRGNQYTGGKVAVSPTLAKAAKIDTREEIAKLSGVSHGTVAKVKVIEERAPDEIKQKLSTGEVSINQAYKEIKSEEKKQELQQKKREYESKIESKKEATIRTDIFNTETKYRVIYADPPWSYNDKQASPQLGGAEKHYDSMTIKELCELPIKQITQKDAVLFLWVTSPLLEECFDVINSWGFKYKASFIWDKVKHNMGHYNSVRHEFLLIAGKGSAVPDVKELFDSVQSIEKTNSHSEKPIEFMDIIDKLYIHGERIELFCRNPKKENWEFWGNEV